MTAMAHEPMATDEETLLDYFLALETPKGFRAELIEGEIVVTPPPDNRHERFFSRIIKQILAKSETDMDVSGNKGVSLSHGDLPAKDYVIPDATFVPSEADIFDLPGMWIPSSEIALVLEVTSSSPHRDRVEKRHCYARTGIPLYLLADREKSTMTLFSEPEGEDYTVIHRVPFGKSVPLPAPFSFDLETTDFL
ncbi:Uma2 family endonuclease [Streptomyces sp. NPDC101227]|uniref:Uma2 family endonuclease n=1 Tax=Streptomyces sp. NPDC101227 TaxID=3366136 RepID=UPI00380600A9